MLPGRLGAMLPAMILAGVPPCAGSCVPGGGTVAGRRGGGRLGAAAGGWRAGGAGRRMGDGPDCRPAPRAAAPCGRAAGRGLLARGGGAGRDARCGGPADPAESLVRPATGCGGGRSGRAGAARGPASARCPGYRLRGRLRSGGLPRWPGRRNGTGGRRGRAVGRRRGLGRAVPGVAGGAAGSGIRHPAADSRVSESRERRSGGAAGVAGDGAAGVGQERAARRGHGARVAAVRAGRLGPRPRPARGQPHRGAPWGAIGSHRDRDSHRRPRRAPSGDDPAPAGRRHLSRHRHLRRQYRHPDRLSAVSRASVGSAAPAAARDGGDLRPGVQRRGRRRGVGDASHHRGGDRPRRPADRPPDAADQRARGHRRRHRVDLAAGGPGPWIPAHLRRHPRHRARRGPRGGSAPASGGTGRRCGSRRRSSCLRRPSAPKPCSCRSGRPCSVA